MRWANLAPEYRTLGGVLRQQADAVGDDVFLMDPSVRWTYAEVNVRVNRIAHGLRVLDVKPGDRVLLWLPNSAERHLRRR